MKIVKNDVIASVCTDGGLEGFLQTVEDCPALYSQVVICSPFVDTTLCERILHLAVLARSVACQLHVITGGKRLPAPLNCRSSMEASGFNFCGIRDLHAKVYFALGRDRRNSTVIVTSANLTLAGLNRNVELGLRVSGASSQGAIVIAGVYRFLELLIRKER